MGGAHVVAAARVEGVALEPVALVPAPALSPASPTAVAARATPHPLRETAVVSAHYLAEATDAGVLLPGGHCCMKRRGVLVCVRSEWGRKGTESRTACSKTCILVVCM